MLYRGNGPFYIIMSNLYQLSSLVEWSLTACFDLGAAIPCLWQWKVSTLIVIDEIPDPEIGIDFCSSFPVCMYNRNLSLLHRSGYYTLVGGVVFLPILSFFSIIYCKIGHFLWLRKPIDVESSSLNHRMASKKRVTMTLFLTVATFFFCRIPHWIYTVVSFIHAFFFYISKLISMNLKNYINYN